MAEQICPDCKNTFHQPFVCRTCGAQKLYDSVVRTLEEQNAALLTTLAQKEQELATVAAIATEREREPVAWLVESTFAGEEIQRDIYLDKADAEHWQSVSGGVVIPLVCAPTGPVDLTEARKVMEDADNWRRLKLIALPRFMQLIESGDSASTYKREEFQICFDSWDAMEESFDAARGKP